MWGFRKIFLNYFFIFFTVLIFEIIFNKISSAIFFNLIENILFTLILICPLYYFKKDYLKKYYLSISYFIFSISVYLETVYYYLFKTTFSASAIFIALDTNSQEAKEFIGFYIDETIILFGIIVLVIMIISLLKISKTEIKIQFIGLKILGLAFGTLIFLKFSGLIIYNLPYMIGVSSLKYHIESKKLGNYKNNKIGNFTNVSRISDIEEETYVIIIGESTARSHLGIYNYYRNTTPLLEKISDELLIYNNVISPDTYTIASLTKALTLGNYENPEGKYTGSIIQLLNKAKFKTYWISNQKPLGANDSHVTKIGLGTNESFFFNIKNAKENTIFDEVLVKKMNEILSNKEKRKVIFLHTLGTHANYKNRYPERFRTFSNSIPKSKFKEEFIYEKINSYDNAVRYTDHIIHEVIKSLRKTKTIGCVLYFSDHGEEVFDNIKFSGHFKDKIETKNVYEIPMILWASESYKNKRKIYPNLDSKYMIDDLFHSIADLVNINANEVDSTRSIFSKYYKERKRIVFDTIDFDTFFKNKRKF